MPKLVKTKPSSIKFKDNVKLLESETIDYLNELNMLLEMDLESNLRLKVLEARAKTRLNLCKLYQAGEQK